MLLAAFVCAAGAATLAYIGLKNRSSQQAVAVAPEPVPTTKLVVAARDMKTGDKLSPEVLREVNWPAATMPKGAFRTKDAILKGSEERVLVEAVAENEPVLARKVSGFGEIGPMAAQLGDGMRAITIKVSEDTGVGGFAQAGDRVDVLLTRSNLRQESGGQSTAYTATLVQDARVLATDQQTQRRDKTTPPKAVTLEVSAEDAQKLVLGAAVGQLSLTLARSGGRFDRVTGVIQLSDLEGIGPNASPSAANTPSGPVVGVTRSTDRKEYRVMPEETSR
jgi:pilus assembly protein CpaB